MSQFGGILNVSGGLPRHGGTPPQPDPPDWQRNLSNSTLTRCGTGCSSVVFQAAHALYHAMILLADGTLLRSPSSYPFEAQAVIDTEAQLRHLGLIPTTTSPAQPEEMSNATENL